MLSITAMRIRSIIEIQIKIVQNDAQVIEQIKSNIYNKTLNKWVIQDIRIKY